MSRVLEQKSSKQENVWQENMLKFWQKVYSLLSMEKSTGNEAQQRKTKKFGNCVSSFSSYSPNTQDQCYCF